MIMYVSICLNFFHNIKLKRKCYILGSSSQDGDAGRNASLPQHNQKKDNNEFKNKKQPELPENQTVWKSDNQEVKEETFILTCRRGGHRQLGQRGLLAKQ